MKLTFLALGVALAFSGLPQFALAAKPGRTLVQSELSPEAIAEYVGGVELRLERGKYDVLKPKDRAWIVAELKDIKTVLVAHESSADLENLQFAFSEFETGIIEIEEGGIVCEKSTRTGSRMAERRCMTRKRQTELREKSRDSLRDFNRATQLPSGG